MAPSLHQLHRYFLPTTTDRGAGHDRGSVAVLSVVWLALSALGCIALVGMTRLISERARLQNAADVVALAFMSRDRAAAEQLSIRIGVRIRNITVNGNEVTVEVSGSDGWAMATASGG